MTMRFTTAECVTYQRAVRLAAMREQNGLSVSEAFAIAESVISKSWNPGRPAGTRVNDRNEVVPIRAPRPETKPTKRLFPVTIDSLVEADGDVNEAEIEFTELGQPAPALVAGEDEPEDDGETDFERAVDAAATDEVEETNDGDRDE